MWRAIRMMANDCLALLTYLDKHHPRKQSLSALARAAGIPRTTLDLIIREARECDDALLYKVAWHYGFSVRVFDGPEAHSKSRIRRGQIVDAVLVGYEGRYNYC
jgi:hypothetical protein